MEPGAGVGEVVVDVVAGADALVSPGSVGVEGPVAAGQLVAIDHDPHQGDAEPASEVVVAGAASALPGRGCPGGASGWVEWGRADPPGDRWVHRVRLARRFCVSFSSGGDVGAAAESLIRTRYAPPVIYVNADQPRAGQWPRVRAGPRTPRASDRRRGLRPWPPGRPQRRGARAPRAGRVRVRTAVSIDAKSCKRGGAWMSVCATQYGIENFADMPSATMSRCAAWRASGCTTMLSRSWSSR
jgi:hypothetical protein